MRQHICVSFGTAAVGKKKKELSKEEYDRWEREIFELPTKKELNQSESMELGKT